jgi:hypothetical protein
MKRILLYGKHTVSEDLVAVTVVRVCHGVMLQSQPVTRLSRVDA